ncbi:hypothetical protein K7432_016331 [Basidiobolus ranarum]|uniref:Uncharacterized protein n=1 Tax=Basidiobolus ranarum TaxID=34480 RepID=A0ABR2VLR3_9FUNG
MKYFSLIFILSVIALASGLVDIRSRQSILRLKNTRNNAVIQLPFPLGRCERVDFEPVNRARVTPGRSVRFVEAVLYRSLSDCFRKLEPIALVPSNRRGVSIERRGRAVNVGAVFISQR